MEEETMTTNKMTRRGFLGLGAAAGVLAAGAALAGCSPKQATEEESKEAAVEGPDTIDESLIADTVDCDVVVCGLGVSGVAALRAAAESGAKVVGVEKTSGPNCRSSMFAAFNCDTARQLGVEDIDPTEIANELMIQMAHRGDYRVINKWLANCGEAFEWYVGAYDGLLMVGPEDEYPEDPEQIYLYADAMAAPYRFGIDHERNFSGCCCVGGGNETHRPILEANIQKALDTGNAQTFFDSPVVQLDVADGRVTGAVCQNLADGSYTRYVAAKGVVLATGDYSFNDDMLKQYAPWVYANKDKYLFSHEAMDTNGNHASMGDGQRLGIAAGGHVDVAPHAVMAHIFQFGAEFFLELNERGQRFCNEDLSMTNIAKVMVNQPGSKVFQIVDATAEDYYPVETMLGYIRSYDDGEMFSAEADTLEDLAAQLGFTGEDAQEFVASVERYNELCAKGHDDDWGCDPQNLLPIKDAPFFASFGTTGGNPSGGLCQHAAICTDGRYQVLTGEKQPIAGLYAAGNTCGQRYGIQYATPTAGNSCGSALTSGYCAAESVIEDLKA